MSSIHFVVLGNRITTAGAGSRATVLRSLLRELASLGHDVLLLENTRTRPTSAHRTPFRIDHYSTHTDLRHRFTAEVSEADVVIVQSGLADGIAIGEWVTRTTRGLSAFLDLNTPHTLAQLATGTCDSIAAHLVPRYSLYLTSSGGAAADRVHRRYCAPCVRVLLPCFDPGLHTARDCEGATWDLGWLPSQASPASGALLLGTAQRWGGGRFAVAGVEPPPGTRWPDNVEQVGHPAAARTRDFYCRQRFTLHVSDGDARQPSVVGGVLEAAACGTPVISDGAAGVTELLGSELFIARSPRTVLEYLVDVPDAERSTLGRRAQARVMREHTVAQRARDLLHHVQSAGRAVSLAG